MNYLIGEVDPAECYVTILGNQGGGLEPNLDRWRREMGQPGLTQSEVAALERIPLLGTEGVLLELDGSFSGMGGVAIDDAALLGVVCLLQESSVFVKMIGPRAAVRSAREDFLTFCRSLELEES